MEVNDALVKQLAELARLEFNDEERAAIQHDLQRMISFVETLNGVNTDNVLPLLHLTGEEPALRADRVIPSITREQALKNAPLHDNNFFKVPKVIKK